MKSLDFEAETRVIALGTSYLIAQLRLLFRAMLRFNHLANIRVRGLSRVRIHVYLALCAQVLKRIGEMIMERLIKPHARCPATA